MWRKPLRKMTKQSRFSLAALAAAFLLPAVAYAQQQRQCAPFRQMEAFLEQTFREVPIGIGSISGNRIVHLFLGPTKDHTWTLVITDTNKISCIFLSGKDWERQDPESLLPGRKT